MPLKLTSAFLYRQAVRVMLLAGYRKPSSSPECSFLWGASPLKISTYRSSIAIKGAR